MVDFEGHKFSFKLTHVSFDSWHNIFASFASFTIAHSSLNGLKWIDSSVCSKLHPFKETDMPPPWLLLSSNKIQSLGSFKVSIFYVRFCWKMLREYTNDRSCINYACITCLLYCASDVNVIFKTFSITWQQICCHDLHQNVFPTRLSVYVVNISNESVHKGNLLRCF